MKKISTVLFCLCSIAFSSNHQEKFSDLTIHAQEDDLRPSSGKKDLYEGLQDKLRKEKNFINVCNKLHSNERERLYGLLLDSIDLEKIKKQMVENKWDFTTSSEKDHEHKGELKFDLLLTSMNEIKELKKTGFLKSDSKSLQGFIKNYAYIMEPFTLACVLKNYFTGIDVTLNKYDDRAGDCIEETKKGEEWAELIQKTSMNYSYFSDFQDYSSNYSVIAEYPDSYDHLVKENEKKFLYKPNLLKIYNYIIELLQSGRNKGRLTIKKDDTFSLYLSGIILSTTENRKGNCALAYKQAKNFLKYIVCDSINDDDYLANVFLEANIHFSKSRDRHIKIGYLPKYLDEYIQIFLKCSPYEKNDEEISRLNNLFKHMLETSENMKTNEMITQKLKTNYIDLLKKYVDVFEKYVKKEEVTVE